MIPGSVDTIGESAFSGCTYLKYITIGYGVKTIGTKAFSACNKVESLVIPDSVESVGDNAFKDCGNLNTVSLTKELDDNLNPNVFDGCSIPVKYIHLEDNPFTVSGKTATLKAKTLKKKALSVAAGKVLAISPSGTGLDCVKLSGNKNISINKTTGTVSVKKKTKKGTYSIKIKIMSTGSAQYKHSDWKTVTFKIKVKK